MTAVRADKRMLLAHAPQSTPGTILRGVGRVNRCDSDATGFRFLPDRRFELPMRPQGKATAHALAHLRLLALLRHMQVFQHEDAAELRPRHKTSSGNAGEILCASGLLTGQPFDRASYRSGIAPVCLTARKLCLQSTPSLSGLRVGGLLSYPRDKQFTSVSIYGYEGIRLTTINAHRQRAYGFGGVQRHAHAPDKISIALDHGEGVNLLCCIQHRPGVVGDGVGDALTPRYGRDRERAVTAKVGITPTHPDEEHRRLAHEGERLRCGPLVAFGSEICPSNEPKRANRHLTGQRAFHLMVDGALQLHGIQRCACVVARFRHFLLHGAKHAERAPQVVVIGHENGYASLNLHTRIVPQKGRVCSMLDVGKRAFPLPLKGEAPCAISVECGDVILVAGSGIGDRAIRRATGSPWTHCGLAVSDTALVEATSRGVRETPLRAYQARGDLRVRVISTALSPARVEDAVRYARSRVGQEYGYFSIISIWLSLATAGRLPLTITERDTETCSELVATALFHAGVDVPLPFSIVTPGTIAALLGT